MTNSNDRQPLTLYSCLIVTMAFRHIDDVIFSASRLFGHSYGSQWPHGQDEKAGELDSQHGFLLVFCSKHTSTTHRLEIGTRDRQTDR